MNQIMQKLFPDRIDQQRLAMYIDTFRKDENPFSLAPYADKKSIEIIFGQVQYRN